MKVFAQPLVGSPLCDDLLKVFLRKTFQGGAVEGAEPSPPSAEGETLSLAFLFAKRKFLKKKLSQDLLRSNTSDFSPHGRKRKSEWSPCKPFSACCSPLRFFLCLPRASKKKARKKETAIEELSPSAERNKRLCLLTPRAFEKARPKLTKKGERKLKQQKQECLTTLLFFDKQNSITYIFSCEQLPTFSCALRWASHSVLSCEAR